MKNEKSNEWNEQSIKPSALNVLIRLNQWMCDVRVVD